ncbi:MAG: Lar family restriction alleviation protein [Parvibaculaceae bacterium]|nr:Lar family restriction alleviation protein [Parvibaculaceae bacterium]
MSVLNNCPFCGGEAVIENIEAVDGFGNEGGSCVQCTKCLASSQVEFGFKENLESVWNRRVSDPIHLLEQAVFALFGERCPDSEPGCATCDAWALVDQAKEGV